MKILNIKNNTNFKSGLTPSIKYREKSVSPEMIENIYDKYYGIEGNFLQNKSAAIANKYCLKIFGDLSKLLQINQLFPPAVFIYNQNQKIDRNSADNFCIQETSSVLKNEYPFPGRSIFFKNFHNLEEIDDIAETRFKKRGASSSHFLSPFIHEWLHSFHLDFIYKTFGYGGECNYMKQIYPKTNPKISGVQLLKQLETKTLNQHENEIIYDTLGEYATLHVNQYLEIFSETFTKFICDSLNGIRLVCNPFDKFKQANKEFQAILNKVVMFK